MEAIKAIMTRRSIRRFKDKAVEDKEPAERFQPKRVHRNRWENLEL